MTARHFLACTLAVVFFTVLGGAALLSASRHASFHFAEAR